MHPSHKEITINKEFLACEVAILAYLEKRNFELEGYVDVEKLYDSKTDTEFFILEDSQYIYGVPRGTEGFNSWKDIKTDLQISKKALKEVDSGKVRVHEGFNEAWLSVAPEVIAEMALRQARSPYKKTVLTGHSLGGAVAARASLDLCPDHCITFGQPRVGNKHFASELEDSTSYQRYVNLGDIISRVPLGFGYRHAGPMYYISKDQGIVINPSLGLVLKDNWPRWARRFKDHRKEDYLYGVAFN